MKQFELTVSFVLSMIIFSSPAMALGLEYYGVEMDVKQDLSVHNEVILKFNETISSMDYSLDFEVFNLDYQADFEFADCSAERNNRGSTIHCDFIGMTNEENTLTLDFDTMDVIRKTGDNYRFTVNYGIGLPVEASFVLITLPENHILAGGENESYFPNSGGILSDGRRIMVFWEDEGLGAGEEMQYSILFTRPAMNAEFLEYLIYLTAVAAIVLIIFGVFYLRRRGQNVAVVKSVMNRDEKRIIDILSSKGGKAGQKLLVRESDFSKAKVSRIVKSLKDRGVVDTEPISGRENRVFLMIGDRKKERAEEKPNLSGDSNS